MPKIKIVVFTGAGMSAESGLKTFRDADGLWENYDIMRVASLSGWNKDPNLVQKFYNERRAQLFQVNPNEDHFILSQLETKFQINVITQNDDDLHERAGSLHVTHLHGELLKVRCTNSLNHIFDWKSALHMGHKCFFDHFYDELYLIENEVEGQGSTLDKILSIISRQDHQTYPFSKIGEESGNMTDDDYLDIVQKAKSHCQRGDVFQMVLSEGFLNHSKEMNLMPIVP